MIMRGSTGFAPERADEPIPFPTSDGHQVDDVRIDAHFDNLSRQIDDHFDSLSRRIEDLARELKCLGYFDDEPDLPRAA